MAGLHQDKLTSLQKALGKRSSQPVAAQPKGLHRMAQLAAQMANERSRYQTISRIDRAVWGR